MASLAACSGLRWGELAEPDPAGYLLADRLAARIEEARAGQEAGADPLGLLFPSRSGGHWRPSNFNRRILQPAYRKAGWRGSSSEGRWTWHSLRHRMAEAGQGPAAG